MPKQVCGIWLPETDTHFERHLKAGPVYRGAGTYQFNKIQATLRTMEEYRKRRGLAKLRKAVDVGAHVGLWSRVLSDHFETLAAFEPVLEFVDCFRRNMVFEKKPGENKCLVDLYPVALGDIDMDVSIEIPQDNTGNAHVTPEIPYHSNAKWVQIQSKMQRLDSYEFNDVDLIKIDTEGYEWQIIMGAELTILRNKPVIVVEQKPGHGARYNNWDQAAVELLMKLGYSTKWIMSGDYCMVAEK